MNSIYEIIGHKFGPEIQKVASGVFLITRVLADGVRFLATAVVVQVITGWSLTLAVLVIGAVTLIYTLSGGIKTVVWVDSIQFILYLFGGVASIFILLNYIDQSLLEAVSTLSAQGKLAIFNWKGDILREPYLFISALLGGALGMLIGGLTGGVGFARMAGIRYKRPGFSEESHDRQWDFCIHSIWCVPFGRLTDFCINGWRRIRA